MPLGQHKTYTCIAKVLNARLKIYDVFTFKHHRILIESYCIGAFNHFACTSDHTFHTATAAVITTSIITDAIASTAAVAFAVV